jgi:hypothetical protein
MNVFASEQVYAMNFSMYDEYEDLVVFMKKKKDNQKIWVVSSGGHDFDTIVISTKDFMNWLCSQVSYLFEGNVGENKWTSETQPASDFTDQNYKFNESWKTFDFAQNKNKYTIFEMDDRHLRCMDLRSERQHFYIT